MIGRIAALAAACATLVLVGAQDAVPTWGFVHTEGYAVLLAVCLFVLSVFAARAARGREGERGRPLLLIATGILLIGVAGLASGLLGPDTQTFVRAPGTAASLPELGMVSAFDAADAAAIARGDARVAVRQRAGRAIELADGRPVALGTAVVEARSRPAAYLRAFDERGRRLTITQPTGPAFLSPVLQFVQTIEIAGQTLPSDTFATPAAHRLITAVYISSHAAAALRSDRIGRRDVVLFSVRDERGHELPSGIGIAGSGDRVDVAGLTIEPVVGSYPELVVGSAPHPLVLLAGLACIALGLFLACLRPRRSLGLAGEGALS